MTPDDTHRGKIAIKILRGRGNGKKRRIIAYLAFWLHLTAGWWIGLTDTCTLQERKITKTTTSPTVEFIIGMGKMSQSGRSLVCMYIRKGLISERRSTRAVLVVDKFSSVSRLVVIIRRILIMAWMQKTKARPRKLQWLTNGEAPKDCQPAS